jgi:hypothetical protein
MDAIGMPEHRHLQRRDAASRERYRVHAVVCSTPEIVTVIASAADALIATTPPLSSQCPIASSTRADPFDAIERSITSAFPAPGDPPPGTNHTEKLTAAPEVLITLKASIRARAVPLGVQTVAAVVPTTAVARRLGVIVMRMLLSRLLYQMPNAHHR